MKITYDSSVDALYIRFLDTTVTTKNISEGVAFDYDQDGNLAGIEILEAGVRVGERASFTRVELDDIGSGVLLREPKDADQEWEEEEEDARRRDNLR